MLVQNDVSVFEVGPRDGLQNESVLLPVEQKVALIHKLVDGGLKHVEIGSFVHPKWVPQMADTDEVARTIEKKPGVAYWALVPNMRGLERAIDAGIKHVAFFMSSSETHNQKNINRSISESLVAMEELFKLALSEKLQIRTYISTVFGCPFEGEVDFDRVLKIGDRLLELGAQQISLGDTTGMGRPLQVQEGSKRAVERWDSDRVALHLHDTSGLGQTNAFAGYLSGIRAFDSSVGGLGGCPYAPGAPGNLATQTLVNLLESLGQPTGISRDSLRETTQWLEDDIGFNLTQRRSL